MTLGKFTQQYNNHQDGMIQSSPLKMAMGIMTQPQFSKNAEVHKHMSFWTAYFQ